MPPPGSRRKVSQHRQPHTQQTAASSLRKYSTRLANAPNHHPQPSQASESASFWPASMAGTYQSLPTPDNAVSTQASPAQVGGTAVMQPKVLVGQQQQMGYATGGNVGNGYQLQQKASVPLQQQSFQQPRNQQQQRYVGGNGGANLPPQRNNAYAQQPQQQQYQQHGMQQQYQYGNAPHQQNQNDSMEDVSHEQKNISTEGSVGAVDGLEGLTEDDLLMMLNDDDDDDSLGTIVSATTTNGQQQYQPPVQQQQDAQGYSQIYNQPPPPQQQFQPQQQQQQTAPPPQYLPNRTIPPQHQHAPPPQTVNRKMGIPNQVPPPQQQLDRHSPHQQPPAQNLQRIAPPRQDRSANIVVPQQQPVHNQIPNKQPPAVNVHQTRYNIAMGNQHQRHNSPSHQTTNITTPHPQRNAPPTTVAADAHPSTKATAPQPAAHIAHVPTATTTHLRRKSSTRKKRPARSTSTSDHPSKRKRTTEAVKLVHVPSGLEKNRLHTFQRLNLEHQDAMLSILRMGGDVKQRAGNETIALGELAEKLYKTIQNISTNSGSPTDALPLLLECIKQSHSIRDSNLLCNALKILLTLHTESIEVREFVAREVTSIDIVGISPWSRVLFSQKAEQRCLDALSNSHNAPTMSGALFRNGSTATNAPPLLRITDWNGVEFKQFTAATIGGANRLKALSTDVNDEIYDVGDDEVCKIQIADTQYSNTSDVMEIDEPECALFTHLIQLFQELLLNMDACEKVLRVIIPLIDSMVHNASPSQLKVFLKLFTCGHVSYLLHSQFTSLITMGVGLIVPLLMKVPHALAFCHSLQYQSQTQERKTESILQTVSRIIHEVEDKFFKDIRRRPVTEDDKKENFFKLYVLRTEVLKLYSYVISGFPDGVDKLCEPLEKINLSIPTLVCLLQSQLVSLLEEKSFPDHRIYLIRRTISILIPMGTVSVIPRRVGTMEMELDSAYSKLKWIDEQPEDKKVFTFDKRILAILDKNHK